MNATQYVHNTDPPAPASTPTPDVSFASHPRFRFTLDGLSKAAAVLGALVAVGQATTSWITGYWQSQSEREKAQKELALAELKDKSALAESYIRLIIDKNTSQQDRIMLLAALGEIKDHPLQPWAKARYEAFQKNLDALDAAYASESKAHALKNENERLQGGLMAEIAKINADLGLSRDDVDRTRELMKHRVAKSAELGLVRARIGVVEARLERSASVISRVDAQGPLNALGPDRATAITTLASKITAETLMTVFPAKSRPNVEQNAPYLAAAMQEFQIGDPRLAAVIVATIAVETPAFDAYEERPSRFNSSVEGKPFSKYEGRADLGNTQPGDGARYRGRGFLGLTGRTNYMRMSERLGLGTRLVDNPEDAKSPEVAARIVCAFFVDRSPKIQAALDANDLQRIRHFVVGGTPQFEQFSSAYNNLLARF